MHCIHLKIIYLFIYTFWFCNNPICYMSLMVSSFRFNILVYSKHHNRGCESLVYKIEIILTLISSVKLLNGFTVPMNITISSVYSTWNPNLFIPNMFTFAVRNRNLCFKINACMRKICVLGLQLRISGYKCSPITMCPG